MNGLFAEAFKGILPKPHRNAMQISDAEIVDGFFEKYGELARLYPLRNKQEDDWNEAVVALGSFFLLPRHLMYAYTPDFMKRYFISHTTMVNKLMLPGVPDRQSLLSTLAEELALDCLLRRAEQYLQRAVEDDTEGKNLGRIIFGSEKREADFEPFRDFEEEIYRNFDYRFIFYAAADGIENDPKGKEFNVNWGEKLTPDNWFSHIDGAEFLTGPYAGEEFYDSHPTV